MGCSCSMYVQPVGVAAAPAAPAPTAHSHSSSTGSDSLAARSWLVPAAKGGTRTCVQQEQQTCSWGCNSGKSPNVFVPVPVQWFVMQLRSAALTTQQLRQGLAQLPSSQAGYLHRLRGTVGA